MNLKWLGLWGTTRGVWGTLLWGKTLPPEAAVLVVCCAVGKGRSIFREAKRYLNITRVVSKRQYSLASCVKAIDLLVFIFRLPDDSQTVGSRIICYCNGNDKYQYSTCSPSGADNRSLLQRGDVLTSRLFLILSLKDSV